MSYTDGEVATFEELTAATEAPGTTWVWVDTGDSGGGTTRQPGAGGDDAESVGDSHVDGRTDGRSDGVEGTRHGDLAGVVPKPTGDLAAVAERFDIHPLHVEDVTGDVRPKSEVLDEYTFVLVKAARFRVGETTFLAEIRTQSVGLFVGDDWLVTVTTGGGDAVEPVWNRLAGADRRALARGPDFAAYLVTDRVVDGYFRLLDELEDDIETVEELVVDSPNPDTLGTINDLRRELLSVRRVVWPTRDAVNVLSRGDTDHVAEETEKYYRDVYDHLVQLVELTETYRDLTSGARDIYLNTLSQSTNEVMRRLTVVATVVLPLTFVAGVFGMNFEAMPELTWPYAYYATMLGMGGIALVLVAYFRREGWL